MLCGRPESLEEIPPTSFEMLGILQSLISVTGPTSHGAMMVLRVDTWRHLNASLRLRVACPACLHQGGCLSKGQSTNTFAFVNSNRKAAAVGLHWFCRSWHALVLPCSVGSPLQLQPQCQKSLWGASVCVEHVLARVMLGWSYGSTHAGQHATAEPAP